MRRYTPPTCTLEIKSQGQTWPWQKSKDLHNFLFNLRFDDPQLPSSQHIVIEGDRAKLESLSHLVDDYIKEILQVSPIAPNNQIKSQILAQNPALETQEITPSDQTKIQPEKIDQKAEEPPLKSSLAQRTKAAIKANQPTDTVTADPNFVPHFSEETYIQKHDWLLHELFFGNLANQGSGQSIKLTLTQLFDLATALAEYQTDVASGWQGNSAEVRVNPIPEWAYTVAILLVTVGITGILLKTLDNPTAKTPTTVSSNTPNTPNTPNLPNPNITPNPNFTLTPISPSTIGVSPTTSLPSPLIGSPSPLVAISPGITPPPGPSFPTASPSPFVNTNTNTNLPQPPTITPGQITPPPSPLPPTQPQPIANQNQPGLDQPLPAPPLPPEATATYPTPPLLLPPIPPPPPPLLSPQEMASMSRPLAEQVLPVEPVPQGAIGDNDLGPNPVLGNNTEMIIPARINLPKLSDNSDLIAKATLPEPDVIPANMDMANSVKSYFVERWEPQTNLNDVLQLSIDVDSEGRMLKIMSIGENTTANITKAPIPLVGERIAPASSDGKNQKIRVVLMPDGNVQAFSESLGQ